MWLGLIAAAGARARTRLGRVDGGCRGDANLCAKTELTVTVGRRKTCLRTRASVSGDRCPPPRSHGARRSTRSCPAPRSGHWPVPAGRATKPLATPARTLLRRASGGLPSAAAAGSARASRRARARAAAIVTTSHQPPAGHVGGGATSEGTATANGGTQSASMTQSAFVRECPLPAGLPGTGKAGMSMTTSAPMAGAAAARRRLRRGIARGQAQRPRGRRRAPARLRPRRADHRQNAPARARLRPAWNTRGPRRRRTSRSGCRRRLKPGRPLSLSDFGTMRIDDLARRTFSRSAEGSSPSTATRPSRRWRLCSGSSSRSTTRSRRPRLATTTMPPACRLASIPRRMSCARIEPRRVDATVVDREGGRVALTVAARANGATVSPASDGTSGGDPASFTLTPLPAARTATSSSRGLKPRPRVGDGHRPRRRRKVFLYAVSLSGQGGVHGRLPASARKSGTTVTSRALPSPPGGER